MDFHLLECGLSQPVVLFVHPLKCKRSVKGLTWPKASTLSENHATRPSSLREQGELRELNPRPLACQVLIQDDSLEQRCTLWPVQAP
jgi:hypothetical protein